MMLAGFKVLDGFYESFLSKAHVSVMEKDSNTVLVDSMKSTGKDFWGMAPYRKEYVLRVICSGYPTTYQAVQLPKKAKAKYVIESPLYIYQGMEKELKEVTVKASRILMVMKGDTIEYNAAAFRMAEGSMLDNLVRALPGVKLDDNGRITVNGEFVSSLLVNGRDFFNGDPKIALKNLPAYTVNKIKVYHKSDKAEIRGQTELTEEEKKKSPLVMDVGLKREYAQGWISNYEVGGGTGLGANAEAKWLGRLFAMRYTNHSSLAVFAGSNNLNDPMSVGSKGEWKKPDITEGEKTTHTAGINLTLDPKDSPLQFSTDLRMQQQRHVGEIQENGEDYYATATTHRNIHTQRRTTDTDLRWNGKLNFSKKGLYASLKPYASYLHNKGNSSTSSLMRQYFDGIGTDTLYTRNREVLSHGKTWNTGASLHGYFLISRQFLNYSLTTSYTNRRQRHAADDALRYFQSDRNSFHEYTDRTAPLKEYATTGEVLYEYSSTSTQKFRNKPLKWDFDIGYGFKQSNKTARQEMLESTDNELTPSVNNSRTWLIDSQNTYHTTYHNWEHHFEATFSARLHNFFMHLRPTMYIHSRRINDERAQIERQKSENAASFDPAFSVGWSDKVHTLELGGSQETEQPEMLYLLDVEDSSDPMTVLKGNASLKATRKQNVSLSYKANIKRHAQQLRLRVDLNRWLDKTGMAQLYDSHTGITTYMPMNVDGNRALDARSNYSISVGKSGNWSVSNELNFRLARSVDYSSAQSSREPMLHAVRNTIVKEELRLDYHINRMRIGAKGAFEWTGQQSEQHLFGHLKYGTKGYGITFSSPLLWGIDLDTDLMVYNRFGYDDASMNMTDIVWNASLMKPMGKRKQWIVKFIGFDILRQLSTVRREINAQGYTERRYNSMPSYVTLSVFYRLDIKPKKKSET